MKMEKVQCPWITPWIKQCWVTLGVSLNMAQMGLVVGFSSVLLPQLKLPGSSIPIDDNYGSWIASFPAIAIVIGNLTIPSIMSKFGRKVANITTLFIFIAGWICIACSNNIAFLLATRGLQGFGMGLIATLGPLLVGEYASPTKRGLLLMSISVFTAFGVMAIQTLGSHLNWKTAAMVCIGISIINLIIVILSPESPSWLANQGKYEECRTTFRWLRGDSEEEELEKLIASSKVLRNAMEEEKASTDDFKTKTINKIRFYVETIKKNEFYKPFIIMIHVYAMLHWSGVNLLASYAIEFIETAIGKDVNMPMTLLSLNLTRIASNIFAFVLIKKVKRRTLMFSAVGLNACIMFSIAVFTYNKAYQFIQYDYFYDYYIGSALIYLLIFAFSIGPMPLSFILAGEVFPLQYKSLAGGLSSIFFSLNLFVNIKTVPFLLNSINVYGTYMMYGGVMLYLLVVLGIMLPETKDKTLQDIEEEFRGKKENCVCDPKV